MQNGRFKTRSRFETRGFKGALLRTREEAFAARGQNATLVQEASIS